MSAAPRRPAGRPGGTAQQTYDGETCTLDDTTRVAIVAERTAWPRWPAPFTDRAYPLPRPMRSLADFHRALHTDLPALAADELRGELTRLRLRLAFEREPAARTWLRERERRLVAALRQRGGTP